MRQPPAWLAYALAAVLTLATMAARLILGGPIDEPLLELFLAPIIVSAYVGGLGPGLLATALAALLTTYFLLPPNYNFQIAKLFDTLEWGSLIVAGALISMLIEALHRARRRAEASRRLQAVTLASIGDGVITTDAQERITFLNAEAERLTGWPGAEAVGHPLTAVFRIVDVQTRAPADDPVAKVLRSGALVGLANHIVLIGRDGHETPIDDSAALIRQADGAVAGVVLVFRDIAAREQTETALRESQERLAGIVGSAMDAIISIDAAQRIVVFNAAAEQMFGCPAEAAIGQPIDRFVPPRFRGVHAAHVRAFGQTGVTSRSMHSPGNLTALRTDGTEFSIEATISQTVAAAQPLYTVIMRDISAREQAEAARRESEQRYRQIVETAQEGIWQIDASNITTFVNAKMAAILGYTADEMIGAPLFAFIDAENQALATANIERRRQGIAEQHDFKFRRKDGAAVWTLISTNPVLDSAGNYAGAMAMVTDITDRKRAELALRQSEERFATAFHASPAAMLITRVGDGRFIDVNASYERLFGYRRDELIGQTGVAVNIYTSPEQRAEIVRLLGEHGSLHDLELILRTKSGELRTVLCSLESLDLEGEPCLLGSMVDITGRKRAEQALERAAERLRVLADASAAFAEVGTDYQALLDQVARTTAAVLGEGCNIRLLSDDAQWLQLAALYDGDPEKLELTRIVLGEAPLRVDEPSVATRIFQSRQPLLIPVVDREQLRAATKPEYRSLVDRLGLRSMIFVPMRVHGQAIGVLILYRYQPEQPPFDQDDLSLAQDLADRAALAVSNTRLLSQVQRELAERTRAQAELEEERALLARRVEERTADLSLANAELERAARLKDEFLASMSHELRTPLNSILGRSEILQEEIYGSLNPKQAEAIRGIEESGRHLLALINDILDLSKIEAGKLDLEVAPVAVELLCRMCLRMVAQTALQKRISVTSTIDSQVEMIGADERRLKQILVNLLSNAVKFTPAGGKVGLEVQGDVERQTATFTVWDTGIGIAEDDLPRLFKPFIQIDSSLSRQYAGTGLGLALVLRLAQAHGGSVALDSTPGQGSRFSVTLPWNPAKPSPTLLPDMAVTDTSIPTVHHALVIEDSPTAAQQIARYLAELGARVEIHPHGSGAVERAVAVQADVIVLDVLLPDQTGWDILRQLKAEPRTQAIPVMIVSVVDEPERARVLGAAAFLVKPIDRSILIQTLQQIMQATTESPMQTALVIAPRTEPLRILLAEDNQANIDVLQDYLRVKGYDVVVARNGSEALIRAQEAPPAAILMDIHMPGMDGLEAIRRIRADAGLRAVPIVALTALAMPGDRERCLASGADDYLTKPVNLRNLLVTIDTQLHRRKEHPHDAPPDDPHPDH